MLFHCIGCVPKIKVTEHQLVSVNNKLPEMEQLACPVNRCYNLTARFGNANYQYSHSKILSFIYNLTIYFISESHVTFLVNK